MYRIYADNTLIYDSTLEDYRIGKGQITKEADKSGSFVFSVYPDHFYYGQFIQMKTVITVYKSGRIVFRGRILDDTVDYWNTKTLTCEGELGFLQDSVARPFSFEGDHADLFARFIAEHNSQVDDWKKFKVGTVTVVDENEYINRSAGGYGAMLDTMQSALTGSALGGHFYITHGDDGTDPIPTLHYVADFPKTASQGIEFGVNLKDYAKKVSSADLATCVIPLGVSNGSDGERLTIESVNGGKDYIYDANAVAMYGWIVKTVTWDDVTLANHLLTKGRAWLQSKINQVATIELTAIDLHLLDRSIESYNVCEYVHATSRPHGFDAVMLCSRQTMDLLKPENDTVTLGYSSDTLTGASVKLGASVSSMGKTMSTIRQDADNISMQVEEVSKTMASIDLSVDEIMLVVAGLNGDMSTIEQRLDSIKLKVTNGSTSSSIQLMAGNEELGEPATISMSGLVTFTGLADGSTTINGGCIKTGKIDADRLNLTGAITFGDLDEDLQSDIENAGGISEAEAKTLITSTLVASPTIAGGKFYNMEVVAGKAQPGDTWIEIGDDDGYFGLRLTNTTWDGSGGLFSVYDGDFGQISFNAKGYWFMGTNVDGERTTLYGTWDFSEADGVDFGGASAEDLGIYVPEPDLSDISLSSIGVGAARLSVEKAGQYRSYHVVSNRAIVPEDGSDYAYVGTTEFPWDVMYAGSCTCCTSDENKKNSIEELPEKYLAMFDHLTPKRFKMNNGTSGRYHTGFIAQDVKAAMDAAGVDSTELGAWIKGTDKDGNEIYMLRYEEFGAIYAAAIKRLEARVAKLEGKA